MTFSWSGADGWVRLQATLDGMFTAVADLLVEQVDPGAGAVLDVGCGTGYFARLLAREVGPQGNVVGIDAAPEMIDYARRKSSRWPNCQFLVGTAEALQLAPEQFDLVVSSMFMHHLPEELRVQALREMLTVVRPGGTLLVADGHFPHHGVRGHLIDMLGHGAMRRTMAPDLEPLVAAAGFDQIETGKAPLWLHYVRAVRPPTARTSSAQSVTETSNRAPRTSHRGVG